MIEQVQDILLNDSGLEVLIGKNVWLDDVPEEIAPPYVVLSMVDGNMNDTKDGPSQLDQGVLQVWSYGKLARTKGSDLGAYDLMDSVRRAIDFKVTNGLYVRALRGPRSLDVSIPNKPLKGVEMEFEIHLSR